MLHLIYGPKGSGKTKKIIDLANQSASSAGTTLFVADKDKYSLQINTNIRLCKTTDYFDPQPDVAVGFVAGLLASNYDISKIFIDGLTRITGKPLEELESVYEKLAQISTKNKCDIVITVSCETLPDFLKKYI